MKNLFYIFCLLSFASCADFEYITGNYIVNICFETEIGDPPQPFFTANDGSNDVPKIGPIKYVKWNERYLLTEKDLEEENRFYFVIARSKKLDSFAYDSLGCILPGSDTLIGPINKVQIDSLLKGYSIDKSDFKKNSY